MARKKYFNENKRFGKLLNAQRHFLLPSRECFIFSCQIYICIRINHARVKWHRCPLMKITHDCIISFVLVVNLKISFSRYESAMCDHKHLILDVCFKEFMQLLKDFISIDKIFGNFLPS